MCVCTRNISVCPRFPVCRFCWCDRHLLREGQLLLRKPSFSLRMLVYPKNGGTPGIVVVPISPRYETVELQYGFFEPEYVSRISREQGSCKKNKCFFFFFLIYLREWFSRP